jgi:hypothetical protein
MILSLLPRCANVIYNSRLIYNARGLHNFHSRL